MSSPTQETVSDTPPVVPPPVNRKPTASEKADTALALIEDLNRKLEQAFDSHPDISSNVHAAPALTAEQAAALAKVPGLDQDIEALGEALNKVAETVGKVEGWAGKDVAAYEQLREDIRSTLAELREQPASVDVEARGQLVKLTDAVTQTAERTDALGCDLLESVQTLAGRINAVERRPAATGAATPNGRGLARPAVLRLMRKVVALGKTGQAPKDAGGFKFRGIEAVMDAIGTAMRDDEVGLILETKVVDKDIDRTVVNGRTWTSVIVTIRYTFIHPEDDSEHSFEMVGEGRDLGDKSASKAASMAAKYGLCQALMIPFTNMADADAEDPASEQERQRERWEAEQAQQRAEQSQAPQQPRGDDVPPPPEEDVPAAPRADNRTPEEKAAAVVAALNKLNAVPLEEARARLNRINTAVQAQGLGGYIVDGSDLAMHLTIHSNLIGQAERTAQQAYDQTAARARG
jgi:hypothetical protein